MNVSENKTNDSCVPQVLLRVQPARFGWWSDRTLVIVKGETMLTLDADDVRALARFAGERIDGASA